MDCHCTGNKGQSLLYAVKQRQGERTKPPREGPGVLLQARACMSRYFRKHRLVDTRITQNNTSKLGHAVQEAHEKEASGKSTKYTPSRREKTLPLQMQNTTTM